MYEEEYKGVVDITNKRVVDITNWNWKELYMNLKSFPIDKNYPVWIERRARKVYLNYYRKLPEEYWYDAYVESEDKRQKRSEETDGLEEI